MLWKIVNKFCLMNATFVLIFSTNHVFFIVIGSKVTPQNRINVNKTGTMQRRYRKLYWMMWDYVLLNLDFIALKTTIDTSYWNFKKWFYLQCDHVIFQKCISYVVIEFINVLMENLHFVKALSFFQVAWWTLVLYFHINPAIRLFVDKSPFS